MIATWHGKIIANSTSNHISAFWDIMPTLAEIAKIKHVESDGISFLPTLLNKKQKEHKYLYWEYPENDGSKAIRMGKWKGLIKNIKKGNSTMELYDLELDPREQIDVSKDNPRIVKELYKKMNEAHTEPDIERFKM